MSLVFCVIKDFLLLQPYLSGMWNMDDYSMISVVASGRHAVDNLGFVSAAYFELLWRAVVLWTLYSIADMACFHMGWSVTLPHV